MRTTALLWEAASPCWHFKSLMLLDAIKRNGVCGPPKLVLQLQLFSATSSKLSVGRVYSKICWVPLPLQKFKGPALAAMQAAGVPGSDSHALQALQAQAVTDTWALLWMRGSGASAGSSPSALKSSRRPVVQRALSFWKWRTAICAARHGYAQAPTDTCAGLWMRCCCCCCCSALKLSWWVPITRLPVLQNLSAFAKWPAAMWAARTGCRQAVTETWAELWILGSFGSAGPAQASSAP